MCMDSGPAQFLKALSVNYSDRIVVQLYYFYYLPGVFVNRVLAMDESVLVGGNYILLNLFA